MNDTLYEEYMRSVLGYQPMNNYQNTYYNNYANLMLNDITNLKNVTIKAGETQDGILVFMVPEDKVTEIKSIVLTYKDCKLTVK